MKMNYYEQPVILLGGDVINALAMCRNLGKNNIRVTYVSKNKNAVFYSKYCQNYFIIPKIEKRIEILKEFLLKYQNNIKDKAVIFSCSDLISNNLSKIMDDLSDKYIFFTSSQVIPTIVNKCNFYKSLDKYKVLHPITYYSENIEDIKQIGTNLSYPALIKPSFGQLFSKFGKKSFLVQTKRDLVKYSKFILNNNINFIIQEYIPGPALNLYGITGYIDKNHNPQGFFAYKRIREWPLNFGNGSLITSIPLSDVSSLKNIVVKYLKKVKYCGLFDAEFKQDSRNGKIYLIEINARSWWQNHFPTICGLNLVMMAYLDAIGEEITYKDTYELGVKWLHFRNDIHSIINMFKNNDLTFNELLFSYKNIKDYAFFNKDDLLPWLINFLMVEYLNMQTHARFLRTTYAISAVK